MLKFRWGGARIIGVFMKRGLIHTFDDIISVENLLAAWQEFIRGKRHKADVLNFSQHLIDNILELHRDLLCGTYRHGGYQHFRISDPKPRDIHKASVRDRLLHHAIYRVLYPFFDITFIADSYSCRIDKGTHKALDRFTRFTYKASRNNTLTCWVLQCDIKKFFATIDQGILVTILRSYIPDERIIWLLQNVIRSFNIQPGKGLPLGNLTSQLFVNVYMSEFDQFIKHGLKAKYYIRYADDFLVLSHNRTLLEAYLPLIRDFLTDALKLNLHPRKVSLRTFASSVDFLGWIHFPEYRVLRTVTKRRMMQRIAENQKNETLQSYLGLLQHGNTIKLGQELRRAYGLNQAFPVEERFEP